MTLSDRWCLIHVLLFVSVCLAIIKIFETKHKKYDENIITTALREYESTKMSFICKHSETMQYSKICSIETLHSSYEETGWVNSFESRRRKIYH